MEGLVNFFGLWEGYYELRDPDNEWVSMSIAPLHIFLLAFHTVLRQTSLLHAFDSGDYDTEKTKGTKRILLFPACDNCLAKIYS